MNEIIRVVDAAVDCPEIPIVQGDGNAKAVIWPGTGAIHRSMHLVTLGAGARTVDLRHDGDAAYYVIRGSGRVVALASGEAFALAEGGMVHIDAGDRYRLEADADGMTVVGGPCPADTSLYAHLATA